MKHRSATIPAYLILVLLFSRESYALTEQLGLGGISSVAPSGANDAERNPALLFRAAQGATVFAGGITNLSTDTSGSSEYNFNYFNSGTSTTYNFYGKQNRKASGSRTIDIPAGIVVRGVNSAFSVLISSGGDSLYSKNKYKSNDSGNKGYEYSSESETTETEKNPGVFAGWSTSTSAYGTFGISIFASQSVKTTEDKSTEKDITAGTESSSASKLTVRKNEFGMIFGFNYATKTAEAGLTLSPVTFGTYEETMQLSGSSADRKSSEKKTVPFRGVCAKLGFAYNITDSFAVLSELDYTLPMSHNETNLSEENDAVVKTLKVVKAQKKEHDSVLNTGFHAGLRYRTRFVTAMIGGLCVFNEEKIYYKEDTGDNSTIQRTRMIAGTAGMDFTPTESVTIGVSCMYAFFSGDAIGYGNNFSIYGDMSVKQLSAATAVSFRL
jgi:hypothetical protein